MAKTDKETKPQGNEESTKLVAKNEQTSMVEQPKESTDLIPDEQVVSYYEDAISCIKEDREEAHERYLDFCEMVLNEGDPSSATKEGLVNLLKLKNDGVNQMIKVLDLWTRLKMKERATKSEVYAYQQNNKYEVSKPNPNVRKLIKMAQEMESPENE